MDREALLKGALFAAGSEAVNDFIGAGLLEEHQKRAIDEVNDMLDDIMAQIPDEEFEGFFAKYVQNGEKLWVQVPDGHIVAYPSNDPENPGIHIERTKDGKSYALNLATTEYNVEEGQWITHVWGNGTKEDTTHDLVHENGEEYFKQ